MLTALKVLAKYHHSSAHYMLMKQSHPSQFPHRRIPFHMRQQVEQELERLVELDVIERVDQQPTPWVFTNHCRKETSQSK